MSLARKSIDAIRRDSEPPGEPGLTRVLGPVDLVSLGVGAILGTGILALTGTASAQHAGPAVTISLAIAALGCLLAALCYAELAALMPASGSAYSYTYAAAGELAAWCIGWVLVLQYLLAGAVLAAGWSEYVTGAIRQAGAAVPARFASPRGTELVQLPGASAWVEATAALDAALAAEGLDVGALPRITAVFDLLAAAVIAAVTAVLVLGVRRSARLNHLLVGVNVAVVLAFVLAGGYFILRDPAAAATHWTPFLPASETVGRYGWSGVVRGAGVLFFGFVGFEAVTTMAQEAKNPRRDVPVGVLGSLLVSVVLYVLVAVVLTGVVRYTDLDSSTPVALALEVMGRPIPAVAVAVAVAMAAVAALTSGVLILLMAQTRIVLAMSRDGLFPAALGRLHPRSRTPWGATILAGATCAVLAGTLPVSLIGEMVSLGVLIGFATVCVLVCWLRVTEPARERPFRTPLVPWVPIAGLLVTLAMMAGLPGGTWLRMLAWIAIGGGVYLAYGRGHSRLRQARAAASGPEPARRDA